MNRPLARRRRRLIVRAYRAGATSRSDANFQLKMVRVLARNARQRCITPKES